MPRSAASLHGLAALAVLVAGLVSETTPAVADDHLSVEVTAMDRPLGDPDAPVTIIEYASFTCGHCGSFHNETWPELKAQYVDTGQVYFLFRDFPLDGLALVASMLTRCVPEDAYHATVSELFLSQEDWAFSDDPMSRFLAIGTFAGAEEAALEACLNDRPLAEQIVEVRLFGEEEHDVTGTPTFVINGETLTGNRPIEAFAEIIERYLPDEAG